jgi:hypothetical protein
MNEIKLIILFVNFKYIQKNVKKEKKMGFYTDKE